MYIITPKCNHLPKTISRYLIGNDVQIAAGIFEVITEDDKSNNNDTLAEEMEVCESINDNDNRFDVFTEDDKSSANNTLTEEMECESVNDNDNLFDEITEDDKPSNNNTLTEEMEVSESVIDNQTSQKKLKMSQSVAVSRRVHGLEYYGCKRKGTTIERNVLKKPKYIKERCLHTCLETKSARSFLCAKISDDERKYIFKMFWNLKTWPEKKIFVRTLVSTRDIVRRRKSVEGRKLKEEGHDILLEKCDGIKVRVCRKFFINTLGIGEDTFKRWVKKEKSEEPNSTEEEEEVDEIGVRNMNDEKLPGGAENILRTRDNIFENLVTWLNVLPKVPSHYCRASSNKTYVESTFRSVKHLYEVYKLWCLEQNVKSCGKTFFKKTLTKKNIAIHLPRKDQCDLCCSYKAKQINEEEYQNHLKKKDQARVAKNEAKSSASDKKLVITMDLQSVLLCPKVLASKHYYKQKLQIHNFTVYVLNDKNVWLYVWHEVNAGVTANEFTTCIIDFIKTHSNYEHIVLISDGCGHQNRNRVLSSALSDVAVSLNIIIEQLYLEKGHTMMEADSVHATLEKYFKPPINSPSDYIASMRAARPAQPYNVRVLDYSFFKNFEQLNSNLQSLRPGRNRTGEPVVNDIRAIKYLPNGELFFKINHSDEYQLLPQRKPLSEAEPPALYVGPIPLTESKYKHLQELKAVIEIDHHAFYDNLPFEPENRARKTKKKIAK